MIFIESVIFITSLLSSLADNLTVIHKIKRKTVIVFLEYESVKDMSVKYKCTSRNKDFLSKIDEELKKRFRNTFTFSNSYINKCILLSGKCVYPYEYYKLEKFNETSLPEKKDLYSNLNTADITDADYINKKKSLSRF